MPNSKLELSIIIVNYRSDQYLRNCIASLFNSLKNLTREIIIVNNDKQKNLNDLDTENLPIHILHQAENAGYGAACNAGAKIAVGNVLLFLNPDTEIRPGDWDQAMGVFCANDAQAVFGPRLIGEDGLVQAWCAGREHTLWRMIKNNLGIIDSRPIWESEKRVEADWISGGAMFVKKNDFLKIGGFDEKFFMYFEDNDLCKRLRLSGKSVIFEPGLAVKHLGGKSFGSRFRQKMFFYKSAVKYFWKHRSNAILCIK